jgi:exodeoxyribonuclease III
VRHELHGVGENYRDHYAPRMNWRVTLPITLKRHAQSLVGKGTGFGRRRRGRPGADPMRSVWHRLRWFERLTGYAKAVFESGAPAVLAGDFNVMPTDLDVYAPERWVDDALFRPEVRDAYRRLVAQGWTDALRALHPDERIYTFWKYFRNAFARDAGLRIDHLLLSPSLVGRLVAAGVDRDTRAITRRSGSNSQKQKAG